MVSLLHTDQAITLKHILFLWDILGSVIWLWYSLKWWNRYFLEIDNKIIYKYLQALDYLMLVQRIFDTLINEEGHLINFPFSKKGKV